MQSAHVRVQADRFACPWCGRTIGFSLSFRRSGDAVIEHDPRTNATRQYRRRVFVVEPGDGMRELADGERIWLPALRGEWVRDRDAGVYRVSAHALRKRKYGYRPTPRRPGPDGWIDGRILTQLPARFRCQCGRESVLECGEGLVTAILPLTTSDVFVFRRTSC